MQRGGDVVNLQEHIPGQYIEKVLADMVEAHRYNKEFKEGQRQFNIEVAAGDTALAEEQRQFDEQADLERGKLSIMSDQADSTARYQKGQIRLKDEELKRADFREFGKNLNPTAGLAYAKANKMPADIIDYYNNLKVNWDKFNLDYKSMRQSPESPDTVKDWKTFKADNRNNLSMFKDFAPNLGAEIDAYHQGSMNKNLLSTMAGSPQFKTNMGKLGINTGTWATMEPEDATYYLKNLPTWIGAGLESQKLSNEDKKRTASTISKAMEYLSAQYQASAEFNPDDARDIQDNFIELMQTQFKDVEGLDLSKKDRELTLQLSQPEIDAALDEQRRTVNIVTGTGDTEKKVPVVFDAGSNYRIELTNAAGEKSTKTVEGNQAASIQKQKGWVINKSDKIIKPFKMGRSQLDSGEVIKDDKTGKTLTFVGFDLPPEEETVTAGGKKIKRTRAMPGLLAGPRTAVSKFLTGGQKVLYFTDEAGKSVIYTPAEATKATFIEPPVGQAVPDEEPIIAEEIEEKTGFGNSLLRGVQAGEIYDSDSLNQAIQNTAQDSIDLFLQEDTLRQELEDNE